MSELAIVVDNLGKQYRISRTHDSYPTLRDGVEHLLSAPIRRWRALQSPGGSEVVGCDMFWALRDVSFSVRRGEVLGVVGLNGSGKSTLLKILSRITEPTEGRAVLRGRVASLLEVGTGFHPELTGRENIYLNGSILGMRKTEVDRKFDQIVAFSEIERFLDTPVKRYSSGMYVRLAFAVAAHLEPEILIVDEVLAVGDITFQRKCLGRMGEAASEGRTILFVSHNLQALRQLTENALYLRDGQLVARGPTAEIIDRYTQIVTMQTVRDDLAPYRRRKGNPGAAAAIRAVRIVGRAEPSQLPQFDIPAVVEIEIDIEASMPVTGANLSLSLKRVTGEIVSVMLSRDVGFAVDLQPGINRVGCRTGWLYLVPGHYAVDVGLTPEVGRLAWDVIYDFPAFEVLNRGPGALNVRVQRPGAVLCPDVTWTWLAQGASVAADQTGHA